MNRIVVGADISKRVFQLHWVQPEAGEIAALQLKREKFLEHFANRLNCLIGMRRIAALSAGAAEARSRSQIAVGADGQAVCGWQQERCSGCARDFNAW
jgi:hypothetical protein